jgi:hypothetical protein
MDTKFSLPEYPYADYYQPTMHEWADLGAGIRKSWCKKCNAEGAWVEGIVIPTDSTVNKMYCRDRGMADWYDYCAHTD